MVQKGSQYICGNVMAEYKDKIIIIEGDTIKSHEYIIPKSKVDHYDENDLYLKISRHDMILNFEF
jgi:hypothetical protein